MTVRAFLALCALLVPSLAAGQGHPALTDTWTVRAGAWTPKVETQASLNSTSGAIGTSVSFEDDLGFSDRETMGAFLASARVGTRWKIEFEYFALKRATTRTTTRTLAWGDKTYPAGTVVSGEFDSTVYRLSGGYSLIRDDRRELGVALGLHATDFGASLAASGVGTQAGEVLAPLPTIGVYAAYAWSPQWLFSGRADYFALSYDDFDGSLLNVAVGVDYNFARRAGLGVAWRVVDYDLGITGSRYAGNINYVFSGPIVYLSASF